ncbi:transglutaminase family protein [Actinoplanes sp. NPDC051851]|uniref:transglutaminase family protein n=1 Tax=Actinoplanes sp. NPDC051851 TaxID=3154753 RepID=UPI0034402B7D
MSSPVDSWRLKIQHKSGFQYAGPVSSSYNEARMWPRNDGRQAVLDAKVEVWPAARTYKYEDYWGTVVTAFDVHAEHETLTVAASSTVETLPPGDLIRDDEGVSWDDLVRPENADRWYELLLPTRRTGLDAELESIVADLRGRCATPQAAAMAVCAFVREEVAYVPGATGVQSDALHAWAQRKGVCQDLSHLATGMLRALGIPARYVSGYLHPKPDATIGESVVGQSHAWVEWWAGRWTSYDPTNGVPVGERHVAVGRGREYDDVPPLKGIYAGPPSTGQAVEVTITRLR